MLGHLVRAHGDDGYAAAQGSLLRWVNRVVSALLHRQPARR